MKLKPWTVRVYYISQADELLAFEYECSYQRAYAELSKLKPKVYLYPNCRGSVTYRESKNVGTPSTAVRVEIIHPSAPVELAENARFVVLPSQL